MGGSSDMGARHRPSGRINEEYVCVDSFIQHLKKIDAGQEVVYREEPNDPPDFWVTIAGIEYAVEVTSIVIDYGYEVSCTKFFNSLRSEFAASKDIIGTYNLSVIGYPKLPKIGTYDWEEFISIVNERLLTMSNFPNEKEYRILEDKNGKVILRKFSEQGAKIFLPWVVGAKWHGEIQEELTWLFKNSIETKRRKLEEVLHRCSNIILLFYDAYGYSNVKDAKKAFSNIQGYDWLHSVYLALPSTDIPNVIYPNSPGREGVFLYTRNKLWQ
jgi:hypothetical protein